MTDFWAMWAMAAVLLLAWICAYARRDLMHPLAVFVTPLAAEYAVYFCYLRPVHPLDPRTNQLFVLATVSFAVAMLAGEWLHRCVLPGTRRPDPRRWLQHFQEVRGIFIAIGVFGVILGGVESLGMGLSGPRDILYNIRYGAAMEGTTARATYFFYFLHVILMAGICGRRFYRWRTRTLIGLFSLVVLTSLFTMARTVLMLYFISTLGAYILANRFIYHERPDWRIVAGAAAGFTALIVAFAVLTDKFMIGGVPFFSIYLSGPIVAFDRWILNLQMPTSGFNTFFPFLKVPGMFGLYTPPPSTEIGLRPGAFNVYTFMQGPYQDFGAAGLYAVMAVFGLVYGVVYRNVTLGKPYWLIFYSILLYPLVMAFYAYQFSGQMILYYAIVLLVVYGAHCYRLGRDAEAPPYRALLKPAEGGSP